MRSVLQHIETVIITEEQLLARLLKVMLQSVGFERVDVVSNLLELRKRRTKGRHDLVLADRELRGVDGADLLMLARADPIFAPSLIIIVTQDTSFRFYETCMRCGADAGIHKPVVPQDVIGAVVRLLASPRAWRSKLVPHPRSLPHQPLVASILEPTP